MSLDVYLTTPGQTRRHDGSGIFVRENGSTREITREEWDQKFPGREPVTALEHDESEEVYDANITHNLNAMANAAGIYYHLWRPDELGITKARELIEPLESGLLRLETDPERFKALNPPNGWGDYEGLVGFVRNYLTACRLYPDAEVRVWR